MPSCVLERRAGRDGTQRNQRRRGDSRGTDGAEGRQPPPGEAGGPSPGPQEGGRPSPALRLDFRPQTVTGRLLGEAPDRGFCQSSRDSGRCPLSPQHVGHPDPCREATREAAVRGREPRPGFAAGWRAPSGRAFSPHLLRPRAASACGVVCVSACEAPRTRQARRDFSVTAPSLTACRVVTRARPRELGAACNGCQPRDALAPGPTLPAPAGPRDGRRHRARPLGLACALTAAGGRRRPAARGPGTGPGAPGGASPAPLPASASSSVRGKRVMCSP